MPNDPERVREWALVLDSQGIPNRIQRGAGGWTLVVAPEHALAAQAALQAYADENADTVVEEAAPEVRDYGMTVVGIAVALALPVLFLVTGSFDRASPWFGSGAADAERILGGEPWRVVTALTLHADLGHVIANTVSLGLFGTALMITVGPGVGLLLLVLSGALGNYANALLRQEAFVGVGASTAVFGAVGALAGYQFARKGRRRGLVALIAGALLFVLLGTGEHTDILAHFLGLVVGMVLGAVTAATVSEPPGRAAQWALTGLSLAIVAVSWWLAFGAA